VSEVLENQKSGSPKSWKLWGLWVLLCLILVILGAVLVYCAWKQDILHCSVLRAFLAFAAACGVLCFSFPRRRSAAGANSASVTKDASLDESYVRNFIAYDAIVFTVVGLATAVAATPQWETAILLSGACLLIGAFFGLLFGYPQGVVAQTAAAQPEQKTNQSQGTPTQNKPPPQGTSTQDTSQTAATQPGQETNQSRGTPTQNKPLPQETSTQDTSQTAAAQPGQETNQSQGTPTQNTPPPQGTAPQATKDKNLIAESASTLGKVIAGFTLARADTMATHFHRVCQIVGPALGNQQFAHADTVLAGSIILYFVATGFFSGLLLPPYFMSGKL
jgi:hypothetical protein